MNDKIVALNNNKVIYRDINGNKGIYNSGQKFHHSYRTL